MRIAHAIAFAAVASLSASVSIPAFAEGSVATPAHSTVNVSASPYAGTMRLNAAEAQQMNGTYRLDDGRMLVIGNTGSKLFAVIDGKREQLVRTADHRFVARESGREIEFDSVPFAGEVVLRSAAR